jgi:predicted RNA-binding Zn ribbon-like protein
MKQGSMKQKIKTTTSSTKLARRRPPRFDLIAGNVCLDFINTLDDRHTQPKELLQSYGDLTRFGEDTGVLFPEQADSLLERSARFPEEPADVLLRAREMREAMHDVFWAIIQHRAAPPLALARVNAAVQSAAGHMRLKQVNGRFEWQFDELGSFDRVLWPIARAAGELLVSDQLPFVRACASKSCEWFFLDTSKNHHRRWCDMTRCGNRAKVQRFYARQKKNSS